MKNIIIICGPTASGKSSLSMKVADKLNSVIINADSIQLYKELRILTASPSESDQKNVRHLLYNFLLSNKKFSVADYLVIAKEQINDSLSKNIIPIITGGTGLYINAIINGITSLPDNNPEIREQAENIIKKNGISYLYEMLLKLDPAASVLNSSDKQRIIRRYEVIIATGKSIDYFQKLKTEMPFPDAKFHIIYLRPSREFLHMCCNNRFENMINLGAIHEVKEFRSFSPDFNWGATKAIGFKELSDYLQGDIDLDQAKLLASAKTRQYAKRQVTWFNNQLKITNQQYTYSNLNEFNEVSIQILRYVDNLL